LNDRKTCLLREIFIPINMHLSLEISKCLNYRRQKSEGKEMIKQELGLIASVKKLAKPRVSMLFAFTASAALGTIIAGNGFPPLKPTILAVLSTFFITLATYIYNDVIDADMDRDSKSSNKENRPLASGEVTKTNAYIIIIASSILGVGIAWFTNLTTFSISFAFWALFMMYSLPVIRLKRVFVVKSLVTSLGPALTLLVGMSSIQGRLYTLGLFTAFVQWAFLFCILPSIADSFDIEEDTKYGMKTMAMVLSWENKARMLMFAPLFAMVMSIVGYFAFNLNWVFPALSIVTSLLYAKEISKVLKTYDEQLVWNLRKLAFIYYDLNLVFVLIGTVNIASLLPFLF
jgi:4-hydroxybenzoate polyprenyltransferase